MTEKSVGRVRPLMYIIQLYLYVNTVLVTAILFEIKNKISDSQLKMIYFSINQCGLLNHL